VKWPSKNSYPWGCTQHWGYTTPNALIRLDARKWPDNSIIRLADTLPIPQSSTSPQLDHNQKIPTAKVWEHMMKGHAFTLAKRLHLIYDCGECFMWNLLGYAKGVQHYNRVSVLFAIECQMRGSFIQTKHRCLLHDGHGGMSTPQETCYLFKCIEIKKRLQVEIQWYNCLWHTLMAPRKSHMKISRCWENFTR
jgi:hypothetical protein